MTEYRNFWIRIENRANGLYVSSNSTAGGTVAAPLTLPENLDAYQLATLLGASSGASRGTTGEVQRDMVFEGDEAPAPVSDREVGSALFNALLPGPVRDAFMRSVGGGRDSAVRIRLQIDPNDPALAKLASLPWELIYNDVTRNALGRSKYTPIVRSLDVAQSYTMLPFEPPLRVLLVLANPSDSHPLGLDREKDRVVETLEALDGVEVTVIEHATEGKLYNALDTGRFHVLHYMGHGGFNDRRGGALLLEDEHGRSAPLSAAELGDDLAERRSMRLVFLNACDTGRTSHEAGVDPFTGVASALVAAGIPAVVAMQVPVADRAALAFSEKFYDMIAHGEPVDAAVAVGRRAIWRANESSLEWATPVLFMRSEDGYLFSPPELPEAPTPPTLAANPVPLAQAAPATQEKSAGRKAMQWLTITLSVLGAIFVLLMVLDRGSTDDEGADSFDQRQQQQKGAFDDPGQIGPAFLTPAAQDLIASSEFADQIDNDGLQYVAEGLVNLRGDLGAEPGVTEEILSLAENDPAFLFLPVEGGYGYEVVGLCDGDCEDLELQLYEADGETPIQREGDVTFDDGVEPRLRVTPPAGDTYNLKIELIDCKTLECFVGIGVYESEL